MHDQVMSTGVISLCFRPTLLPNNDTILCDSVIYSVISLCFRPTLLQHLF